MIPHELSRVAARRGASLALRDALRFCARALLLAVALSACGGGGKTDGDGGASRGDGGPTCGGETCGAGETCDARGHCVLELASRCGPGTQWTPGTAIFREETDERGLRGVEGTRISLGDIDGDGYPDLSTRKVGGTVGDNFTPDGGLRTTWLLRNAGGERFTDVTQSSGLVTTRAGTDASRGRPAEVIAFADVDNNGTLDAFVGATDADGTKPETMELMLNDGTGHFTFGPEGSPVRHAGEPYSSASAVFVDVDRDGVIDLFLGMAALSGDPQQNQLYLGLGGGNFTEITEETGLTTAPWGRNLPELSLAAGHTNTWSALACDLNGDGVPELLAASYGRAPNHLWLGALAQNGPHYTNRSIESLYAFDEHQDWKDNESARCYCKLHPTAADCAGVPAPRYITCTTDADAFRWTHSTDRQPYRLGGNSGTTVCADLDNDGRMDLLTTEIRHWDVGSSSDASEILHNEGDAQVRFSRPGNDATGLTRRHTTVAWDDGDITAAVFDFDNDGRPDIYIGSTDYPGTRGHLFWQKADHTFQEVPITDGIDHRSSHGIAVADFNRDGALDVVVGHSRNRCSGSDHCYPTANIRFFRNVFAQRGNWLQLALEGGAGVNRSAIGARVTVKAGDVTQTQEVGGGHGHYGMQHDLVLHFGLGTACEAEVTVRWPDTALTTQRFFLSTGYRYKIVSGKRPTVVPGGAAPQVDGGTARDGGTTAPADGGSLRDGG